MEDWRRHGITLLIVQLQYWSSQSMVDPMSSWIVLDGVDASPETEAISPIHHAWSFNYVASRWFLIERT